MENVYPQPGWVEIDPDALWTQFVAVIKDAVKGNRIYKASVVYSGLFPDEFSSDLGRTLCISVYSVCVCIIINLYVLSFIFYVIYHYHI